MRALPILAVLALVGSSRQSPGSEIRSSERGSRRRRKCARASIWCLNTKLRAAAGVRYGGENFGLALGAAYVNLNDPVFPGGLPVAPVLDVSWTFR